MLSDEIIEFFNFYPHLKKYFLGIRNIDTLIKTIPVNHFLICNTDLSTGPGKHWFVLFRYNQRELECFDSLGVGTERQALLRSVQFKSIRELNYNESPVQSVTSSSCGEFCLYFIFERLHNLDFDFSDFLNEIFSQNLEKNEQVVSEFYSTNQNGFVD